MPFIRSISGLRATLGVHLSPAMVADYACAFSAMLPEGPIVIGRDGRPSGAWIEEVLSGALRACGRTLRIAGVVPTPTVQLLTEHSNAVGGISITASHNPSEWNGLKFINSKGVFLSARENHELWQHVDNKSASFATEQQAGVVDHSSDAIEEHLANVLRLDIVAKCPKATGELVVVDAVNASGSIIIPQLLERLGYSPVRLFCDESGVFPHPPEPIPQHLDALSNAVRETNAAFGVAVDPDADRLVLVDEHGEPIGEERTITLAAQSVLSAGHTGPVVVNYSTSRMVDDVAAFYGVPAHRAPVGEINVVEMMQSVGAVIGGEGSGGVIYPQSHSGRDSVVGLALISSLLRNRNQSLSQATSALPRYHMEKQKVDLHDANGTSAIFSAIAEQFSDAVISTEDGIHLAWADSWIHVRASNTEPIMRMIAEAPTSSAVTALLETVQSVIKT